VPYRTVNKLRGGPLEESTVVGMQRVPLAMAQSSDLGMSELPYHLGGRHERFKWEQLTLEDTWERGG